MSLPDGIDENLWVEIEEVPGRCYLTGNGHTFRGRMAAWSEQLRCNLNVSKYEILNSSPLAKAWQRGFLAGNEPDPEEMFGPEFGFASDDDPRWARWEAAIEAFHSSGLWTVELWREVVPFPPRTVGNRRLWTLRGDEVWTWRHEEERWVQDGVFAEASGNILRDSLCASRGEHEMRDLTPEHWVCDDCGWTVFDKRSSLG